jgi:hypothetical protein
MNRRDFDIDHIDPRWEDGRDYQLVCGLNCVRNYREEEPSKNTSKSNRFLPWRWSRDEIGVVPEEYGDIAQFLVNGEWVLMEFLSDAWFQASIGTCSRSHRNIDHRPLQEGRKRSREQNPEMWENLDQQLADRARNWMENNKDLHTQLATNGRRAFCEQNPEWESERLEKTKEGFKIWYDNLSEEELYERSQTISETTQKAMANLPAEKKQILVNIGKENAKKQHAQRWMCTVTGYITTPAPLSCYQKKRGIDPSNRIRLQ